MIKANFTKPRLVMQMMKIEVKCQGYIGISSILETRLPLEDVCALLAKHTKYDVVITPLEGKRFPAGYYQSFGIDSILSDISRLQFVKETTIEVPKTVYITQTIKEVL